MKRGDISRQQPFICRWREDQGSPLPQIRDSDLPVWYPLEVTELPPPPCPHAGLRGASRACSSQSCFPPPQLP